MCVADDCCAKCFRSLARALLIVINIIFLLAGLLMLALGIALAAAPEKVLNFLKFNTTSVAVISQVSGGSLDQLIKAVGIFMIILGGVVAIIAVFGFFGASCDNKCMLVTYAVILIIIVLAETALIIFAAVYPNTFQYAADNVFDDSFYSFHEDATVSATGIIDYSKLSNVEEGWTWAQYTIGCCGVYNAADYGNITWTKCGAQCSATNIPISCCTLNRSGTIANNTSDFVNFQDCQSPIPSSTSYNSGGCIIKLVQYAVDGIKQNSKIAIGIAAGIIGLEIILIVLAFFVCCMETTGGKYV